MTRLNVIGTRLRPIDEHAHELIAEALEDGRRAVAHLFVTPDTLEELARLVCASLVAQIQRGEWARHDVHTLSDMGIIRALPYLKRDDVGQIVGVRVEVWLAAFVEPTPGAEVSHEISAALAGCNVKLETCDDENVN